MRFLCFALLAALLAIPQDPQSPGRPARYQFPKGQQQDHGHGPDNRAGTAPCGAPGANCPPDNSRKEKDHTGRNVAIGIGAGIFAGTIIAALVHDNQPETRLSDEGPQLSDTFHMSAFHITGFVEGGWPLAIDYESEAGTYAVLTITTRRNVPYSIQLPTKRTERHIELIQIPDFVAGEHEIADFTVRATVGKKSDQLAYFRIYGFACGPRGVGSVAIDQLTFGPSSINASQNQTQFGFHTHTAFDRTQAEFLQVALVDHCLEGHQVDAKKINKRILSDQRWSDNWNATKATPGQIQFRVRGWMTVDHGADWVTAFSPDLVLKQ